ncbi:MAG: protein kinase [Kiritimatiellae bacterium]|nr:protein kinase [Kiritimatiellia bacterium]
MSTRYHNGTVVDGGSVPYRIDGGVFSFGRYAVSYAARRPDGSPVFLKQYKAPSRIEPWYRDYIAYQGELKRRIEVDPSLASRTYEFIDMFESRGTFLQVFGFLERGNNLRERLGKGIPSPRERWEFAEAFVSALARFHDAGIVHTDLKPENVFLMPGALGSGWNVKIIDFDFTVLSGRTAPWRGQEGFEGWVGTPRYMSPEHLAGKVPEARSDVFTASLMLYELLAQGHPYPEDDDAYRAAVKAGGPPQPVFPVGETPETAALAAAMSSALSPDIGRRPAAKELLAALRDAREAFRKARPRSGPAPRPEPRPLPSWEATTVPAGTVLLVGAAGQVMMRLDSVFGQKSLPPLIGEEDARFTEAGQFRLSRKPDTGEWLIAAAGNAVRNPPMLDGTVLTVAPMPVGDGSVLFAATSRKNPDVRKGRIEIHLG